MLMTIFGVAGSVALLFAGLGIQSSVGGVSERQFEQIQQYQMIVAEKSSANRRATEPATPKMVINIRCL